MDIILAIGCVFVLGVLCGAMGTFYAVKLGRRDASSLGAKIAAEKAIKKLLKEKNIDTK